MHTLRDSWLGALVLGAALTSACSNPSAEPGIDAGEARPDAAGEDGGRVDAAQADIDAGTDAAADAPDASAGRTWGPAVLVQTGTTSTMRPRVTMDATGAAIAIWQRALATRAELWASRLPPGSLWGTQSRIETDVGNASPAELAADSAGHVLAVWSQSDGTRDNVWASRHDLVTGWGSPSPIEALDLSGGSNGSVRLAMAPSGQAVAVWTQQVASRTDIWANHHDPVTGWGSAVAIEHDDTGFASQVDVAMDGAGNAVAVWRQQNGGAAGLWANRLLAGVGWGSPIQIDGGGTLPSQPRVAMDSAGNAMAVWSQFEGGRYDLRANRFVPATGWGSPVLIENDDTRSVGVATVAVDGAGNAIVVWEQTLADRSDVVSNRYTAGVGWGTPVLLESSDLGPAQAPHLAMTAAGEAIAVWTQHDGGWKHVQANRYVPGAGWGGPVLLATHTADAANPRVAMTGSGDAIVVWDESLAASRQVWSASFR